MTNYFHKYKEYVIYLLIWTIMFLAPIISMYLEVRSGKEVDFNWRPVLGIWKIYIFYLLAFITHNFFFFFSFINLAFNHKKRKIKFGHLSIFLI